MKENVLNNEKSKKYSRSTIGQEKQTNSAALCIEYNLMKNLNKGHIINCFATMKHMKKYLIQINKCICIFETNTLINLS